MSVNSQVNELGGQASGKARSADGPVLAFFDVDGTLTYRDPETGPTSIPRPRIVEALRAFSAAGGVPVLSTGRALCGVEELREAVDFRGAVTMDGAYVLLDDCVVLDRSFPPEMLARMVAEFERVGMTILLQGTEQCVEFYGGSGEHLYEGIPWASDFGGLRALKPDLRFGKTDFYGTGYDAYLKSDYLQAAFEYYNVGEGYHEFVMPGVSKGNGARAFIDAFVQHTGVAPSKVYAFGDSENDISLLEIADVAVVMGQAEANVKAVATYVTDSAAHDGVATALEHFGLI